MTTPARTELQKAWENLRYPIKVALREVVQTEKQNMHYLGVLLVVIASEGLSLLLDYKRQDKVFVDELIMPHAQTGVTKRMAEDLWGALRHGLAHTYDTKFIRVDDHLVEIVVSWGKASHLSRTVSPPRIYLNLRAMSQDLERVFDRYNKIFWSDAKKELPKRWTDERVMRAQDGARPDWRKFLKGGADGPTR
jgi:hypothetical protein